MEVTNGTDAWAKVTEAPKAKKEKKPDAPLTEKQLQAAAIFKELASSKGFDASDLLKVLSSLKKSGDIKGPGKGKQAEDTPFKISIRTLLTSNADITSGLNSYFTTADKDGKTPTSLMVKLNDKLSVNFVRKIVRVKKAKVVAATDTAAQATKEAGFAEPQLA